MNKHEIALQLTLKALDEKAIIFNRVHPDTPKEKSEELYTRSAKYVVDFYNTIVTNIAD